MAKATFGAGCFWGVEARFRALDGVQNATVGYAGGTTDHPTYEQVCSGQTGHAEVCQVEFDPDTISYDQLLDVFFAMHDPTTPNRQGFDIGTQYRSAIFFADEDQQSAATAKIRALGQSGRFPSPVVTKVEPAGPFWAAEEYHQNYVAKQRPLFR